MTTTDRQDHTIDPRKPLEEIVASLPTMTPELFIAGSRFVFAKTMPHIPHEYTVKGKTALSVDSFYWMAAFIRLNGYRGAFGKTTYTYYEPGDGWRYWTMGAPMPITKIINRAHAKIRRDQ